MIRFLNYLPASKGSKPLPIRIARLGIASGLNPLAQYSTPMTGRHWIGCGCLENVAMEFMCGEGFGEVCKSRQVVNQINVNSGKKFIASRLHRQPATNC